MAWNIIVFGVIATIGFIVLYSFWDRRAGVVHNLSLLLLVLVLMIMALELEFMIKGYLAEQHKEARFLEDQCSDPFALDQHERQQRACNESRRAMAKSFGKVVSDRILEVAAYLSSNPVFESVTPIYVQLLGAFTILAVTWIGFRSRVDMERNRYEQANHRHSMDTQATLATELFQLMGTIQSNRKQIEFPRITDETVD